VRSRCPRLRFGPLKAADVAAVLTRVDGWTEAEAMAAAATADGSVARAIAARDDDLSSVRTAAQSLLDTAAKSSDPRRLLDAAKDVGTRGGGSAASEREELATRLRALASVLRDLGILSTRADVSLLANADVRARLDALTEAFDACRAVRAFSAVDRALAALERNASPKIVADWLALQL